MKQQITTKGIILSRTDFGESDRIITVLTTDQGKLRLMSKGVRKIKSKLAGGIELFSVSDLSYISGRGDIGTLTSSRLIKYYGNVVHDINRVQLGYKLIKLVNQATEDQTDESYFDLLQKTFSALDDLTISELIIESWFEAQLLKLAGHSPNLRSDEKGKALNINNRYNFDVDQMNFIGANGAKFKAAQIKVLRLLFSDHEPRELSRVEGIESLTKPLRPLINLMFSHYIHSHG